MAGAFLFRLAVGMEGPPDASSAFVCGLLTGVEQGRAEAARRRFRTVWQNASDERYRTWLHT